MVKRCQNGYRRIGGVCKKRVKYYDVLGRYSSQYGWEAVCTEDNLKDAKERLKEYNENEPEYPHKIKGYYEYE